MSEKKNQTAVSDEEIIAALLSSGSIQDAAQAVGIAPRTIYDRIGTRDFRAVYSAAKSDIIRQAVFSMCGNIAAAVNVIIGIMNNEENPAGTRLSAAKLLLDNAGKFTDRLSEADKTTAEMAEPAMGFDVNKL